MKCAMDVVVAVLMQRLIFAFMNYQECLQECREYGHLKNQIVISKDTDYYVKDIFPAPEPLAEFGVFRYRLMEEYQSPELAISAFLTSNDLHTLLLCKNLNNDNIALVRLSDVEGL